MELEIIMIVIGILGLMIKSAQLVISIVDSNKKNNPPWHR